MDGTAFSSDNDSSAAAQRRRVNKKAPDPRLRRSAASTTASSWEWVLRIQPYHLPIKGDEHSASSIPNIHESPLLGHMRQQLHLPAGTTYNRSAPCIQPPTTYGLWGYYRLLPKKEWDRAKNGEESTRDPTDGVTVKGIRGCIELKG